MGKKCIGYGCSEIVYKERQYACCSHSAYLCSYCRIRRCDSCKEGASTDPLMQAQPMPSPSILLLRVEYSSITETCSFCSQAIEPPRNCFRQVKCDVVICYSCLYDTYSNYCKETAQGRSQTNWAFLKLVQLPCGCPYHEIQVVNYLNVVCYDCQKTITSECILMKNQARLCQGCFAKVKRLRQNSWTEGECNQNKHALLALKKIEKHLLSCTTCQQNLLSAVFEVNGLCFCCECLNQAQIAESSLVMQQQESIIQTAHTQSPKVAKTKQCTLCSRTFEIGENTLDICQVCATGNQDEEKMVDEKQSAQQHGKDLCKTNEAGEIHHTKMESEDVMKDEQDNMDDVSQKNEDSSGRSQKKMADPYEMPILTDSEEEMRQCSQCLILFEQTDLLKVYERQRGKRKSARIASDQGQLEKETTQSFCLLCYFDLKYSTQQEKNPPQKFIIPQEAQHLNFDEQSDLEEYLQFTHQTHQITHGQFKKCKKCGNNITLESSEDTCISCRQKKRAKAVQNKCKMCRRQKEIYELVNGVCQSCDPKRKKREEIFYKNYVSAKKGVTVRECSEILNSACCAQCKKVFKNHEMRGEICRFCDEKRRVNPSAASGKKMCILCRRQKEKVKDGICEYCSSNHLSDV